VSRFVVIENTPGYLPDDDDPPTFDEYADAVAYLNERAAEYADDPDAEPPYRVEHGWASADNLAAVMVYDDSKTHDLGRYIGIEIDHDEVAGPTPTAMGGDMPSSDHTPPPVGALVRAFHPARFGVVNTGRVVSVGTKYAQVDFGPLLGGTFRVAFRDILEVTS
jgi:hypothetical protein